MALMMSYLAACVDAFSENKVATMVMPFDAYPHGGQQLLGRLSGGSARWGYGLRLQRITGQTRCAWCDVDLVANYYRWLLLSVDHVVPTSEAKRLGIPLEFSADSVNHVLACTGCNGFDNRYQGTQLPQETWTLEEFIALRDAVFRERLPRIAQRRARDLEFFESRPWHPPQD